MVVRVIARLLRYMGSLGGRRGVSNLRTFGEEGARGSAPSVRAAKRVAILTQVAAHTVQRDPGASEMLRQLAPMTRLLLPATLALGVSCLAVEESEESDASDATLWPFAELDLAPASDSTSDLPPTGDTVSDLRPDWQNPDSCGAVAWQNHVPQYDDQCVGVTGCEVPDSTQEYVSNCSVLSPEQLRREVCALCDVEICVRGVMLGFACDLLLGPGDG